MTMNSKMASAVHIMCYIAYAQDPISRSEAIAASLKTNPVVVRKILKLLEREGLVELRQGRKGGVALRQAPEEISLGQIYQAIENDNGIFALRGQVHEKCPVARSMKTSLEPLFDAANNAVLTSLNRTTLAQLVSAIV